jgi:hypothetical protein
MVISARHQPAVLIAVLKGNIDEMGDRSVRLRLCRQFRGAELFTHPTSSRLAMPVIPVGSQIFDLAFHPTSDVVYTGLLDGKVKAFTYDEQGAHSAALSLRISKRSCRGLALSPDGSSLYAVGKTRSLQCVSVSCGLVRKI